MKIEEVVEALNKHLEDIRISRKIESKSRLVLLKQLIPDPTFKIYKTLNLILYYVNGKEKYPVVTLKHTLRVPKEVLESSIKEDNINFIRYIFNWVTNGYNYEEVVKGEYHGNKI